MSSTELRKFMNLMESVNEEPVTTNAMGSDQDDAGDEAVPDQEAEAAVQQFKSTIANKPGLGVGLVHNLVIGMQDRGLGDHEIKSILGISQEQFDSLFPTEVTNEDFSGMVVDGIMNLTPGVVDFFNSSFYLQLWLPSALIITLMKGFAWWVSGTSGGQIKSKSGLVDHLMDYLLAPAHAARMMLKFLSLGGDFYKTAKSFGDDQASGKRLERGFNDMIRDS